MKFYSFLLLMLFVVCPVSLLFIAFSLPSLPITNVTLYGLMGTAAGTASEGILILAIVQHQKKK